MDRHFVLPSNFGFSGMRRPVTPKAERSAQVFLLVFGYAAADKIIRLGER
jgi:hypothetical protein